LEIIKKSGLMIVVSCIGFLTAENGSNKGARMHLLLRLRPVTKHNARKLAAAAAAFGIWCLPVVIFIIDGCPLNVLAAASGKSKAQIEC
jgi:hypothetical protein